MLAYDPASGHHFCKVCGKSGRQKRGIAQHVEARHVQTPGFQCPHCDTVSKSRYSLSMHVYRNHKEHK
jgi:uncharacterized C2H2 Zn-finger protein